MEITDVETVFADRYLFVRIHTDEGITGLGESGTWGYLEASAGAIEAFKRYLVGQNPLDIEHHWNYLYRNAHFRGNAILGGLSAIDIALWDIAGKHFGVPVYQLLGGKVRDKARVYAHAFGASSDELIDRCKQAKQRGFTAVGHLSPLLDEPREKPYFETHAALIDDAVERVRQYRKAVGNDVDLCIEIHRRLDPAQAIALGRQLEPFNPMFIEDPIRPDNLDAMARVARQIGVPIATGERLTTVHEFEMLLGRDAVDFVRPDVCQVGGLTHAKKIAAVAEAHYAQVVPHNPLSPVSTAACLQLAACIPNFAIQEYPFTQAAGEPGRDLVTEGFTRDGGFLEIPDAPGIGVSLDEAAIDAHPYEPREVVTRRHVDGSVVDQ